MKRLFAAAVVVVLAGSAAQAQTCPTLPTIGLSQGTHVFSGAAVKLSCDMAKDFDLAAREAGFGSARRPSDDRDRPVMADLQGQHQAAVKA